MLSHTGESTPFLQHQSYVSLYKKAPWYRKKTFYLNLIRRSMAELLSTALFVFVAVSSFINVGRDSCLASSATTVGLVHGLAYAALMAANRHVRYMEYCIHISFKLLTWDLEYIYSYTCILVVQELNSRHSTIQHTCLCVGKAHACMSGKRYCSGIAKAGPGRARAQPKHHVRPARACEACASTRLMGQRTAGARPIPTTWLSHCTIVVVQSFLLQVQLMYSYSYCQLASYVVWTHWTGR